MKKRLLFIFIMGMLIINSCASQEPQIEVQCTPNWECSDWSKCNSLGNQLRECKDTNNCGSITSKPLESESCSIKTDKLEPIKQEPIGDLVVTGAEAGVCYVKEINMWSKPGSLSEGASIVGKISNACPKTKVPYYEERDLRSSTGRIWYKIKSDDKTGWITDSFVIGKE